MARTASPGPGRLPTPTDRTAAYSVQFLLVEDTGRASRHASKTVKHVFEVLKDLHGKDASRAAEHRGCLSPDSPVLKHCNVSGDTNKDSVTKILILLLIPEQRPSAFLAMS
ncbi:hypothetical protein A6R68_14477 [Neotoma lepida]|uniref:Uncharacterized protein n=1 Tax=Neotoma lepida TaxID=56216 RepID=A0A1A6H8T1_NEOLE|nr:hypothetical protein A6R68_14477 [Neotoma lepida]